MTMLEIVLQGSVYLLLATNVESRGVDYFEHDIGKKTGHTFGNETWHTTIRKH